MLSHEFPHERFSQLDLLRRAQQHHVTDRCLQLGRDSRGERSVTRSPQAPVGVEQVLDAMFLRVARRAWACETSQPPTAIATDTMIATAATTRELTRRRMSASRRK